mmetsp:Transcript_58207/g.162296  ORF Transcript_58207/g.162296 Transcript_58207/m.162296 type:complete len:204 (-) Transcript_58207:30-641(-)
MRQQHPHISKAKNCQATGYRLGFLTTIIRERIEWTTPSGSRPPSTPDVSARPTTSWAYINSHKCLISSLHRRHPLRYTRSTATLNRARSRSPGNHMRRRWRTSAERPSGSAAPCRGTRRRVPSRLGRPRRRRDSRAQVTTRTPRSGGGQCRMPSRRGRVGRAAVTPQATALPQAVAGAGAVFPRRQTCKQCFRTWAPTASGAC